MILEVKNINIQCDYKLKLNIKGKKNSNFIFQFCTLMQLDFKYLKIGTLCIFKISNFS